MPTVQSYTKAAIDTLLATINSNISSLTSSVGVLNNLGTKGYSQITASQGSITSTVDVSGLTVTFNAISGRRYRIYGEFFVQSTVANDVSAVIITGSDNVQLQSSQTLLPVANTLVKSTVSLILVANSTASRTYKLRALRAAGSGNITIFASTIAPAYILVEDIGT